MKKRVLLGLVVGLAITFNGCGSGNSSNGSKNMDKYMGNSNIPYLKQNHASYKENGSSATPAPKKDENKLSINWTITASSVDGAKKLADHINFMVNKLKAGENPRAWDKLFLMEAYMKVNHYYTTDVEQSNKEVVISKVAKNRCAYDVISAHSDAVSGDFFAQGIINKDYSSIAENILNSNDCTSLKDSINDYINSHKKK